MDYKGLTGGIGGGAVVGGVAAGTLPATGGAGRLLVALAAAGLFATVFTIRYKWRTNKRVNQK